MKLTKETEYKDILYIQELFPLGIMQVSIEYLGYDIAAEGTEYEKRRNHYKIDYLNISDKFSCFVDISFEDMLNKITESIKEKRRILKKGRKHKERTDQIDYFVREKKKEK